MRDALTFAIVLGVEGHLGGAGWLLVKKAATYSAARSFGMMSKHLDLIGGKCRAPSLSMIP